MSELISEGVYHRGINTKCYKLPNGDYTVESVGCTNGTKNAVEGYIDQLGSGAVELTIGCRHSTCHWELKSACIENSSFCYNQLRQQTKEV